MTDEYIKQEKTTISDQVLMYLVGKIDGQTKTHKAEYKGFPTKQVNVELGQLADWFDPASTVRVLLAAHSDILHNYEASIRTNLSAGTKLSPQITILKVNPGLEVLIDPRYRRAYVLSPNHSDYSGWDFARGNPDILKEVDF